MRMSDWADPADESRNPQRREERRHARDEMEARLRERRIFVAGSDSDDEVVAMLDAVEAFEARVSALGGDTMVDTPESSEPEDRRLVVPVRRDDEPAWSYVDRVRQATADLGE